MLSAPLSPAHTRRKGQSTVGYKSESIAMQLVRVSSYVSESPLRSPSGRYRNTGCSYTLSRFDSITTQSNCCRHVPDTVMPIAEAPLNASSEDGRKKKPCSCLAAPKLLTDSPTVVYRLT